jgi:plastocyanin domain-containing protein
MKRIFLLLLFISLSACTTQTENTVTTNAVATISEDGYQDISLSYGKVGYSFNYILTPDTVQAGIPVRVTADVDRLKGCYRTVTIPEYDIKKYLSNFDNTFEFTPEQTGDIVVTCSMGMATTTLKVI